MSSYNQLKQIFHEAALSSDIAGILHWDMSTMMPKNSRENRAEQLAYLSKVRHQLISSNKVGELILKAKDESLDDENRANLREMEREYIMSSSLPSDLVEKISSASAKCEGIWEEARKKSDFKTVLPFLEELVILTKQESLILSEKLNCSSYEALINKFEPQANEKKIKTIFENLETFLSPLIDQIIDKQKNEEIISISNLMTQEQQKEVGLFLMQKIGFDFNRGRLDTSQHPFCGGAYQDIRITTRYNETDPFSSLEGIMHETGHAMYELNLPSEWKYQPAGQSRGMAMHESQSLLIEMQITRSKAFKKYLSRILKNNFKKVRLFQNAVWNDVDGTLGFDTPHDNIGGNQISTSSHDGEQVHKMLIDSVIKGVDNYVMKIDIEAAECRALDSEKFWMNPPSAMTMEWGNLKREKELCPRSLYHQLCRNISKHYGQDLTNFKAWDAPNLIRQQ